MREREREREREGEGDRKREMQQNFLNTKCFLSHEFFMANVRECEIEREKEREKEGDDKINRLEIAPFGWLSPRSRDVFPRLPLAEH